MGVVCTCVCAHMHTCACSGPCRPENACVLSLRWVAWPCVGVWVTPWSGEGGLRQWPGNGDPTASRGPSSLSPARPWPGGSVASSRGSSPLSPAVFPSRHPPLPGTPSRDSGQRTGHSLAGTAVTCGFCSQSVGGRQPYAPARTPGHVGAHRKPSTVNAHRAEIRFPLGF